MIKVEAVIDKEVLEKVKKGISLNMTEKEMLCLPPDDIHHLISDYEDGRNTFNKITHVLSEALLRKLPSSGERITIQLIAK